MKISKNTSILRGVSFIEFFSKMMHIARNGQFITKFVLREIFQAICLILESISRKLTPLRIQLFYKVNILYPALLLLFGNVTGLILVSFLHFSTL